MFYILGEFHWAFYTQVVLAAIAFAGNAYFMYVQCKTYYLTIFRKWKESNRVLSINNCRLPIGTDCDSPALTENATDQPQSDGDIAVDDADQRQALV